MKSQASVEIDRPIDEVFRLTVDHVAEWSIVVVEDEVLDQTPDRVGSTFRTVTEDHGRRMEFDGVVTRHEPPRNSAVQMTGKHFDIEADYRFDDLGGGRTRVTQSSTVNGKGLLSLAFTLFGWLMSKSSCKAAQDEMESLRRYCEAQIPAPA